MTRSLTLLIFFTATLSLSAQNPLEPFEVLFNKVWKAEGKWGDGSQFKQEVTFKYDLNKTLVIADSKGYIDKEQTQFGNRNHGIRKYDTVKEKVVFWEFGVFGGVTEGTVSFEGTTIVYTYKYGDTKLSDTWERINENTYRFTVSNALNPSEKYLETLFIADLE